MAALVSTPAQNDSALRARFSYLSPERGFVTGAETRELLSVVGAKTIPPGIEELQPPVFPDYIPGIFEGLSGPQLRCPYLICLSGAPLNSIAVIRHTGLAAEEVKTLELKLAEPFAPHYTHLLPPQNHPRTWNNCTEYFVDLNAWTPMLWREVLEVALLHGRKKLPFCALGPTIDTSGDAPTPRFCVRAMHGGIWVGKTYQAHFGKNFPICVAATPSVCQSAVGASGLDITVDHLNN